MDLITMDFIWRTSTEKVLIITNFCKAGSAFGTNDKRYVKICPDTRLTAFPQKTLILKISRWKTTFKTTLSNSNPQAQ